MSSNIDELRLQRGIMAKEEGSLEERAASATLLRRVCPPLGLLETGEKHMRGSPRPLRVIPENVCYDGQTPFKVLKRGIFGHPDGETPLAPSLIK